MILQTFPFTATILSALCAFVMGLIWYHPKILGTRWMEVRGLKGSDIHPNALPFLTSFILWILAASFYSFLVDLLNVESIPEFVCLSCLLWVAFAMPPTVMGALYTGYPFEAVAIDTAYQLSGYYIFAAAHILIALLPIALP